MLAFFNKSTLVRAGFAVACLALLAAVPIFPGISSFTPIDTRTRIVTDEIVNWLYLNKLTQKIGVSFEVFYTNGIKENASYGYSSYAGVWYVSLDPSSQRSYLPPSPVSEGGWSCPGATVSDSQPTGYWQWQGACVGTECSYGNPVFVVTGWSGSSGVLQNCA